MSETPPDAKPRGLRHWLPRGAVLFLVLAAVLVLVFVVLRPDWLTGESDDAPAELRFDTYLTDIGLVDGLRLSDDNATSQSFTMSVPVDSRLTDPQLSLVGTTSAAEDSTVFLRVLADGQSVLTRELEVGEHELDLQVDLPASATEDGTVRIQVRITGSLDQRRCNITEELGALVWLDPDRTRVYGTVTDPLHSVRDVVAGLDHDITLDLAFSAGDRDWFETAARYGTLLTAAGHEVTYRDATGDDDLADVDGSRILMGPGDALVDLGWAPVTAEDATVHVGTVGDVAELGIVQPSEVAPTFLTTAAVSTADTAGTVPRAAQPEVLSGNAVTLESLGVDTSVQQLTSSRTWRASFSLADLPTGTIPTEAQLQVSVPVTSDDSRWLVQTRLNGQLVDSQQVPGDRSAQEVRVVIPPDLELVRNQLEVTLLRDRDLGGCNVRQSTYQVQLMPSSTLILGGGGTGFTAVPAEFAAGFDVVLPTASTDDPAASLAGLVPTLAEFSGWQQELSFDWDGTPGERPFFLLGDPPAGVTAPVEVADGRITSSGFDLQSFDDGTVVQRAESGSAPGLVVTAVGDPGTVVPVYGRESARLVASDGGGFVVSDSGRIVTVPPVHAVGGG